MSELGPELPPEVYRRRRIVAVVVLLLILVIGIVGISTLVNQINKEPNQDAAAEVTASSEPFQSFSARPTPSTASASGSPDASASPKAGESGSAGASGSASPDASQTPGASASATKAEAALCSAQDLKVTVEPSKKRYAAGEVPSFHVVYANSAGSPCYIGGEKIAEGVEINITSGSTQVYSSTKCEPAPTKKTEIPAGQEAASDVTWDRKLNTGGCNALKNTSKGTYWVTATVNGVTSQRVNFLLN